jgi:hypothetical protein
MRSLFNWDEAYFTGALIPKSLNKGLLTPESIERKYILTAVLYNPKYLKGR